MAFIMSRYSPSKSPLLSVFIMNICHISSNLSTSIEMIIRVFSFFLLMGCLTLVVDIEPGRIFI